MMSVSQFIIKWMTSVARQSLNPDFIVLIKSETEFSLGYLEDFRLLRCLISYGYEDAAMRGESEKQRHGVRRKVAIQNRNCARRYFFDTQFLVPEREPIQQPSIRIMLVLPDYRVVILVSAPCM